MGVLNNLNVDAVLCISTRDRVDRREHLEEQFKDSGLNIEYVIVDRDVEDGQRGCFHSHQLCASIALERNCKNVLILEDDITLEYFSFKKINRINAFLKRENPDIFYLGATLGKIWLTWDFNIARIRAKGTYAYVLSSDSCRKIVGLEYKNIAIDKYYPKIFKGYSIFPMMIGHQVERILPSSISSTRGDYFYTDETRKKNYKKQFLSVFRNIFKTIFRIDV